jgi:hypothetical protein
MTLGESRGGNSRFCIIGPLAVLFEVHDDKQLVVVQMIRSAAPRRN